MGCIYIYMGCIWIIYGIIYGLCIGFIWLVYGLYVAYIWIINHFRSEMHVQVFHGPFLSVNCHQNPRDFWTNDPRIGPDFGCRRAPFLFAGTLW